MIANKNKELAEKYKTQGNNALMNEHYDLSIEFYNKAIQLDPSNPIYYNNRAFAYFKKQLFLQALEDANYSLQLNPYYLKAFIKKIQILIELDQIKLAQQSLIEAMAIQPNQQLIALKNVLQKQKKQVKINQLIQLSVLPSEHPQIQNQTKMLNWLIDSGLNNFEKLKLTYFSQNYRGVLARKKINKKQKILFIHRNFMITLEMAKALPLCKKIIMSEYELLSPKHTYLALYLLDEKSKKENSFWKSYIGILPSHYKNFPIFFEENQLKELEGSNFLYQIKEKVVDLQRDYETVCKIDPNFSAYSFKQFCWARITVCSRIFGLLIDGIKTDALVPYADMLNHRIPKQTSWNFSQELQGFVIESLEDIPRGQQVFDSYGKKCNSRFFLNYGFILKNNDANQITIRFNLKQTDPLFSKKKEIIHQKQQIKIFRINKYWDEVNFLEMLGYLRFLNIKEISKINLLINISKNDQYYKPTKTPPIDIKLELDVWRTLYEATTNSIKLYPTSIEADRAILNNNQNLSENIKNCILLRIGQKQLFLYYQKMATKMIGLLSLIPKQIRKQYTKQEYKDYSQYLQKIVIPLLGRQ